MKEKRHLLRKAVIVVSASLVLVEAVNKLLFLLAAGKEEPGEGETHAWKQGNIFYRKTEGPEESENPPILLVHDLYPDRSSDDVRHLAECLAKDTTVYAMDLLGCGRSEKPAVTYTNFLYVQQVAEMAEKVIGTPVHLVALGRSADIAVAAARYAPDGFTQVTLVDPVFCEKNPARMDKLKKTLVDAPVLGPLIYHYAFGLNRAANRGGASARHLYASILGHYTEFATGWMREELTVPCRTVWECREEERAAEETFSESDESLSGIPA